VHRNIASAASVDQFSVQPAEGQAQTREFRSEPMTSLTISNPNRTFSGLLHEIGRALASMAAGARAARDYQVVSNRTDAALAREGIDRHDVPRIVLRRNFA
jgi:hypothetical protein